MARTPEFHAALYRAFARASVVVLLLAIGAVVAYTARRQFHPYHIGSKAIEYDDRADHLLDPAERITVISTALEDGRGIVALPCDSEPGPRCIPAGILGPKPKDGAKTTPLAMPACDTQAVVADAWHALLVFCVERKRPAAPETRAGPVGAIRRLYLELRGRTGRFVTPPVPSNDVLTVGHWRGFLPASRTEVCPEDDCAPVELGGLAVAAARLLLSEPHAQRVTEVPLYTTAGPHTVFSAPRNGRINDLAAMRNDEFVVVTSDTTADETGDHPTRTAALQIASAEGPGSVRGEPQPLSGLGEPIGVAYSTAGGGRFYLVDLLGDRLRWSYRDWKDGQLGSQHTFWTMTVQGARPALLHMVTGTVANVGEVVFAGGPDGLYVFHPEDGALLAKYTVGRPVQGLSWGKRGELYMTVGRYLCVLKTKALSLPLSVPEKTRGETE